MFRAGLLLGFLLFGCLVQAEELSGPKLVAELRKGGYVLYVRHASTDFGRNDANMTSYEDCASQRNLTDKGRDEARAIGAHLKRLGIPVGEVLASPFCRTVETAMLAFGKAKKAPEVRGGAAGPDAPWRYDGLKELFATMPAPGTNTAIASHANPYQAIFGLPYLAEGEMAVIRPGGPARFEALARIRLSDWSALVP